MEERADVENFFDGAHGDDLEDDLEGDVDEQKDADDVDELHGGVVAGEGVEAEGHDLEARGHDVAGDTLLDEDENGDVEVLFRRVGGERGDNRARVLREVAVLAPLLEPLLVLAQRLQRVFSSLGTD